MANKIYLLLHIFSIFTIIYCASHPTFGYEYLFLLPLFFEIIFCFSIFTILKNNASLTFRIVGIVAFMRYALLPLLIAINPNYHVAQYYCSDGQLISAAILYMCYELFFVYIFFLLKSYEKRSKLNYEIINITDYANSNKSIKIYLVFAIFILLLRPSTFNHLNFFKLDSSTMSRVGSVELSTIDYFFREVLLVSILLVFVLIAYNSSLKFYYTRKNKFLYTAIIGAILCVSIIVGEQRSQQVYTGFACIYLMRKFFPEYKKKITALLCIAAAFVLVLLSIYKTFYAFNYTSYIDAIAQSDTEGLASYQGEIYLLGPISVASALDMKENAYYDLGNFVYDFFRSTMGLNFFVKDSNLESTSVIYNKFVSGGTLTNGFLLPISVHGALYLGYLLGPLLICLFYSIALYLEKLMIKSKYCFVQFFAAYVFIRFSTCMVACNVNTLLTMSSLILIFVLPVYFIQKLMNRR